MALGLRMLARIRAMYEGKRLIPWVSTPRRSARTRAWEIIEACEGATPWASRSDLAKDWAEAWETWRFEVEGEWSGDGMVC
jgi:hypothetical protein